MHDRTTCGIRHFRLGIVIVYNLIIKFVSLTSDGEAEASYTATVSVHWRKPRHSIETLTKTDK